MVEVKSVRFVDIYEDLEKSLTRWLLSDKRTINFSVEKVQWKAKQFAKELEVDNFDDVEWCKKFFDKFCESNNTNIKRDMENLIVGIRQLVTSKVEPIGKVPVDAVGCLSNVIISLGEQVVCNIILCCMANGTKLPPMIVTNVPFQEKFYEGIRLIHKDNALIFDDSSAIEWLNSMWCLRHNCMYQPYSLLVTNISLAENVKKLFMAAATEIVVVPTSIENIVHPLEKEIKETFADVFRREYQTFLITSGPENIVLSSKKLFQWISLAWKSISSDTVITNFQKLGLFYEEEATVNTYPMIGFESEKSYANHMTVEAMQKIIMCSSENKYKEDNNKSISSTSYNSIPRKSVLKTDHTKQISLVQQQRDKVSSRICTNNYSNTVDDNDIEIVYDNGEEKDKDKNSKAQEIKCFMCNLEFASIVDLFIGHNCINLDNNVLDSNVSDGMNTKRRECYYCRTKFKKDIDLLSHVCDYPF